MANYVTVSFDNLVQTIYSALLAIGVPENISRCEAQIMADADLMGVPSHGIRMLPGLKKMIEERVIQANPHMEIIKEKMASCLLNCGNGPGRHAAYTAMNLAIERSQKFGIGICVATGTTHWGRAHAYAYQAARCGLIGICTTNAVPNMISWGSSVPLLGNNPLAIGVPRKDANEPVILDIAMSQASVGKLSTYKREGKKTPGNWGLDSSGNPTDDPSAILASQRILPTGDHKGAGLALMMEFLTGPLADALLSQEIAEGDKASVNLNGTKTFIAIDVSAFVSLERYTQRVEDMLDWLHQMEPDLTITFPGERGWQTREKYLAEGIPIHPEIVSQLAGAGILLD